MFSIAILIGIYSYIIFSLGLLGLLYKGLILSVSLVFFAVVLYFFRDRISIFKLNIRDIPGVFLILLLIQTFINFIGALGPELGFDALWYHLTLPKIFLESHKIIHIPGGLLYYSDMPKLAEMFYIPALSLGNEILAKLIHFSFGLLTLFAIYKLSRKFLDKKFSTVACVIFYSGLVVGWQSITAYIDLARTFFEIMALWGFLNYVEETKSSAKRGWFIESAVMLGLAVSTKFLSLSTLLIFFFSILYLEKFSRESLKKAVFYILISLYVVLPWLLFSFFNTGNPVYPFLTNYTNNGFDFSTLNPIIFLRSFWDLFTHSPNPVSPLYIIFLPLVLLFFRKFNVQLKLIAAFTIFSFLPWTFLPKDSRYILPALAAFSILISYCINLIQKDKFLRWFSISLTILVSIISIFYRGAANFRYLPVILGVESKNHFLIKNLNFNYGDFYDTDGYFSKHISSNDRVLLYGFHNLFYVNFPFIDSSYVKKRDEFNYIAVQKGEPPERFKFWKLIYSNSKTNVKLYSFGGEMWAY